MMSGAWPKGEDYGNIWGMEWKTACFNAWDPEKPRSYDNFNPFERNLDGAMSDMNGCFPGESRGYQPPNRPDVNWAIMQEEQKLMATLKENPKFSMSGKPGNWSPKWQDGMPAPGV